jgi:hypothetical protein
MRGIYGCLSASGITAAMARGRPASCRSRWQPASRPFRIIDVDPLEQRYTREVRLEKWEAGVLVASEAYTLRGQMNFKNELLLMLNIAGFREITARRLHTTNRPPLTMLNSSLL